MYADKKMSPCITEEAFSNNYHALCTVLDQLQWIFMN